MKVWIDETRSATTTAVVLSKVELLRKRAEQGDADAQLALGFMYFDGQSVPYVEAPLADAQPNFLEEEFQLPLRQGIAE